MNENEIIFKLKELLAMPHETECLEFKAAKNDFDFEKIGTYFSALSNEANLKSKPCSWLVFGIENKTHKIKGTNFKKNNKSLQSLKQGISVHTTDAISFMEIHEITSLIEGRVIMFQIPAAPIGIPIAWKGHYYARNGESLTSLNIQKIEQIRNQLKPDWSAQIINKATVADLDVEAIKKAKKQFIVKNPKYAEEIKKWDNKTFLNKAKLTIQGKITRTAIILLGKSEAKHFISPSVAQITWILKDKNKIEVDYAHFGPPFIVNVDEVFLKIRNLIFRYLPNQSLFPNEVTQYEPWVIREALHNCIAHQNYELNGRISLLEYPSKLIFANPGSFIPGNIENVIMQDSPPAIYRNKFLSDAMVNLNMIDTIGSGIRKMFIEQKKRFFPLPSYDLRNPSKVVLRIDGKILNEDYTKLLIKSQDLKLEEAILLDKVQRKIKILKTEHQRLKSLKLVEGRYPHLFVSAKVASTSDEKARYVKNRAFDNQHYQDMICKFIKTYGLATRKDIDGLIINKLSALLTDKQKKVKVNNLINEMANKSKKIKNTGSCRNSVWVLNN